MIHYLQKMDQGPIDSKLMGSSNFEAYLNHKNINNILILMI